MKRRNNDTPKPPDINAFSSGKWTYNDMTLVDLSLDGDTLKALTASAPPKPAPLPVEASTDLIVGYRGWRLIRSYPHGVRLASLNERQVVEPHKRIEATCKPYASGGVFSSISMQLQILGGYPSPQRISTPHPAPSRGCTCGVYAFKDSVLIEGQEIVGEVNLWGRVLECEKGYRAQFAYPKRLALVNGGPRAEHIAADLELTYGVPCEVWA